MSVSNANTKVVFAPPLTVSRSRLSVPAKNKNLNGISPERNGNEN
jgi:hypothetical protein